MSQHSDVTHTDITATKLFSRNCEGMFQQDGTRAHTSKATIVWLDANIKHYRTFAGGLAAYFTGLVSD